MKPGHIHHYILGDPENKKIRGQCKGCHELRDWDAAPTFQQNRAFNGQRKPKEKKHA